MYMTFHFVVGICKVIQAGGDHRGQGLMMISINDGHDDWLIR